MPFKFVRSILRSLPLVGVLVLGGALGVTGGGFGGRSQSEPPPSSSSTPSPSTTVVSPTPSTSSDEPWTWEGVLIVVAVVGGLVVFGALSEAREERRRDSKAVRVQLLLSNGADVKRALRDLAASHDPDAPGALAKLLHETASLLLSRRATFEYGASSVESGKSTSDADGLVGRWAIEARAAFETQTTSSYQDGKVRSGFVHSASKASTPRGVWLAVTLAVATSEASLPAAAGDVTRDVEALLRSLSALDPARLERLEVVWSPDGDGEFLDEDEALARYKTLAPL
ncbi:DUF1517 domain-containing protein [Deinococcus yavapaiensis]|uniref:Putative membrane protein n=1 Tax=Deinococcus yavapaiensis KR-236 TaxID=694435 RepID=A0A318S8P3_9DEIO|nr:DUF1517 domain-containing protein [Deinococcus yavapaiensis]PYE55407.1 putative membrane protein [Deinococcus yavapaiensis KR-236]